jgi:hypothetical protein
MSIDSEHGEVKTNAALDNTVTYELKLLTTAGDTETTPATTLATTTVPTSTSLADEAYAWITDNFLVRLLKSTRFDGYTLIMTSAFFLGLFLIIGFIAMAVCICKRF